MIESCDQSGFLMHSSVVNNVKSISGWNLAIKARHANARKAYLEWRNFNSASANAQQVLPVQTS